MENFIVSARKYRPSTFGTVVGQPVIVQTLKNAIRNNSLAQAFLFTGPRGIGKTTCARILAKTINCLNLQDETEPCNACESCLSFNKLASFNIQELDAASNNSVDDIRVLVDQVRIPPQAGKYKVYIIDEVHMLSSNAFNAFLKTLEEPPAYAKFILATTERHKILPTILSRCQIYDFKRITVTDIASHLAWVAQQEQITYEDEALHIIAQKADGALRDALSIFDQIVSFSGKNITYKNVIENLNLLDYEYYFRVFDCVNRADIPGSLLILDEIIDKGFDGHHFITGLGEHLRNLLLCKSPAVSKLLEVSESIKARFDVQAKEFSMIWLIQALDLISKADQSYRLATNKRLHLELLLLQLNEANQTSEEKKKPELTAPTPIPATAVTAVAPAAPVIQPAEEAVTTEAPIQQSQEPPVADDTNKNQYLIDTPKKSEPESPSGRAPVPEQTGTEQSPPSNHSARRRSIKSLMEDSGINAIEEEEILPDKPEREIKPLDQEEIQGIINDYAEFISTESPSFAAALTARPIAVEPENRIMISFTNKVTANPEHLKNLRLHIRSKVSETWFTLEAVIDETIQAEKVILSPKEKFRKMAEQSPGLEEFTRMLGLEFEE